VSLKYYLTDLGYGCSIVANMKNLSTLVRIYLSAVPGGLRDLRRLARGRPAGQAAAQRQQRTGVGALLSYLKPSESDLADAGFFRTSTEVMLYFIVRAMAQIANHDAVGRFSAGNIPDSVVALGIAGEGGGGAVTAAIRFDGGRASAVIPAPEARHAEMEFGSFEIARSLFDGKINALGCIGRGDIRITGNAGILDNVNRLLDRVAEYVG
jgi:hypothetical protein